MVKILTVNVGERVSFVVSISCRKINVHLDFLIIQNSCVLSRNKELAARIIFFPGVFLDSPTGFTVDAKSVAPTGEGKVRAIVTSPSGQRTESLVKNNKDGTYDVLYTPYEQGRLYQC